jgi:pimeloyl-ACP methyl ester carboxylesterase
MELLETATGPIAYDDRSPADPSGPPLVLLPSGAHDHHDFDALRAALGAGRRTIAVDWPAHGASPPGDGAATVTRFADVAEEVVERLAPDGAIVVGNSVGGFAATRLAIRRPELVRGLVIVDGGGLAPRPPRVRAFCALMAQPWFLRRIYPTFSARYMRSRTDADRRAQETGVATTRRDPGLRAVSELWRSFASPEHDLRADLPTIAAPTLLVWGRRDPVIPVAVGRAAAAAIPGARLVELDTGHVPFTTDPDGVAAALVPFIDTAVHAHASDQGGRRGGRTAVGGA